MFPSSDTDTGYEEQRWDQNLRDPVRIHRITYHQRFTQNTIFEDPKQQIQQHQVRNAENITSGFRSKKSCPDRLAPEQQKSDKDDIVDTAHQGIKQRIPGSAQEIGDPGQHKETDEQPHIFILSGDVHDLASFLMPANAYEPAVSIIRIISLF